METNTGRLGFTQTPKQLWLRQRYYAALYLFFLKRNTTAFGTTLQPFKGPGGKSLPRNAICNQLPEVIFARLLKM
ncbi:hypothetical protein FKM82_006466 [Ascaphus truei]